MKNIHEIEALYILANTFSVLPKEPKILGFNTWQDVLENIVHENKKQLVDTKNRVYGLQDRFIVAGYTAANAVTELKELLDEFLMTITVEGYGEKEIKKLLNV